jgi:hypothetical protein
VSGGRPSTLPWQVLRVLTIGGFVAVAVLAVRALDRPEATRVAEARSGELPVAEALAASGEGRLAVRGYVHEGGGFPLRLCSGLQGGDPPRCVGPFLELLQVDAARFGLERGTDDRGRRVLWSPRPVTLLGTIEGTRMTVAQVLQ